MICSRCGHTDIPEGSSSCPNCGFAFKSASRLTSTASFRALSARRKMLTSRQYSMPFALGEDAFDEYVIRDLLGQGPLGVVYLATNERGDQFALKVLHKRWRSEVDLEQLHETYQRLDEIKDGTRLNLPTQVLVQEKHLGLGASYLEGLTVRKLMNLRKNTSKAFRLDELNQLVHGIATPLKLFHREGIAHGGLKPENFFVTSDENQNQVVTLSDPCLSTGLGIEAYYKAQRASGVGHYFAPELSEGKLSLASDVYSLGVFIFEGITGQAYQTKKSIKEIIPGQGIEPLEDLMTRALHPDLDQRYRDVSALLSAYEDVAKHLDALEGSPFNSEGTQPRNESVVTRFSLTNIAKLDESSDPLLGGSARADNIKTPPPLPIETTERTPPPLPVQSHQDSAGGQAQLFPIHEATPPNLDVLGQLGDQKDSIPSLDAISRNENLKLDQAKTPLSISVGAPQSRPIPISPKKSNGSIWLGAIATLFVALVVYMFLNQTPVSNTPIEVAIKLPTEASQVQNTQDKAGIEPINNISAEATAKKAEAEAAAEKAEAEAAAKKAEAEAAAKKAEAEAAAKKAEAEAVAKKAAAEAAAKKAAAEAAAKKAQAKAKKAAAEAAAKKAEAKVARRASSREAKVKKEAKAAAKKAQAKAKKEAEAAAKKAQAKAKKEAEAAAKKAQAKAKKESKIAARKKAASQNTGKVSSSLKTKTKSETQAVVVPEKVQKQDDATVLSCPKGMILKRTARFPRGSVRRGKIKGKRAIQLARKGKAYCIDAYEYPGRGQKPKVNITFNGAKSLCEQAGKRLCSGNEWVRACKGRGNAMYPYGKKFNANKCITVDKEDEERRRAASGSMRSCKSASGAYDMSGNVAEWTSDQRVRGGYYASYDDEATCKSGGRRAPSSKRGYIGFRCCMDFKK